jgi:N-ethylmaleimide reductase
MSGRTNGNANGNGSSRSPLFSPYRLGPLVLSNRLVMAPMTRSRADALGVPGALAATYYAQRATAGLIITEAAHVRPDGIGCPGTPGIHSDEQTDGWRRVTDAVHAAGGRIFMQIWHAGRLSHPSIQPDGRRHVAPSALAAEGTLFTTEGRQPYLTPRALETAEIPGLVDAFADAARRARRAGFDGMDIHGANGYLIDQFLRDGSNQRTDAYGGSIAGRARFLLEVVEAVAGVWGVDRVGVRLSPLSEHNSMRDRDPFGLFVYVAAELHRQGVAYLHTIEPGPGHPSATPAGCRLLGAMRREFAGCMIVDGGRDRSSATSALLGSEADLVALATPFIANPDLVDRLRHGLPLAFADPATFYSGGFRGYTDYTSYTRRPGRPAPSRKSTA